MKKLLFIVLIFCFYSASAQYPPGYTGINARYDWLAGKFRNGLHIPAGCDAALFTGQYVGSGALYMDTCGSNTGLYMYLTGSWIRLADTTDLAGLSTTLQDVFDAESNTAVMNADNEIDAGGFGFGFSNLDYWFADLNTNDWQITGFSGGGNSNFIISSGNEVRIGAGVSTGRRSEIKIRSDSIIYQPVEGAMYIDSLRSGHPTDTTYKPMVWSPTNKSWRYLTGWPASGSTISEPATQVLYGTGSGVSSSSTFTFEPTALNMLNLIGTNTARSSIVVHSTQSLGNSSFYFENDRGSFLSYGGLQQGGSANGATFFGVSAADKTSLLADGTNSTGMLVGTLTSVPIYIGTNTTERMRVESAGGVHFSNHISLTDISAPSTPSSGDGAIYVNTDAPYFKDDGGLVTKLNELQSKTKVLESPGSSENAYFFYTDKAITVQKVAYALRGSSPSVTFDIVYHTDRSSGSPSELFGSNVVGTSTTGTTTTSFSDATIPAGSYVWILTSAVSGTITEIGITLTFKED